jgi:hypothetical protein
MTVHADRGKIVAPRMENGCRLLHDRRQRGTLRGPLPEWAESTNSDIPGWISPGDIRSELVRATIDLGRQGYSREFLTRILFVTLARSIACSRSASPARPCSTGFSLCDFDFRSRGKAHRLKSVLPKAALHRIAYRHIKLTSKKRIGIRFAFVGNEGQALQKKTGAVGLVHLRFCGARPCRLTWMSYHS